MQSSQIKRALLLQTEKVKYGPITEGLIIESKKQGIDILFFDKENDYSIYNKIVIFHNNPLTIPYINTKAKLGWYMCDLRNPAEFTGLTSDFDIIFLCNKEYTKEYEKKFDTQVEYIPQCGFHIEVEIEYKRDIDWDVVFIGNITPNKYHYNRNPIIDELSKDFDIKVVSSDGYTKDSKWLYQESPFSLAISPQSKSYTSNRLYNILASKGFCLTLWFPGIEELFENHKHLCWFKTPEEAKEIMEYYFTHPEKYVKIREQGYELYLKEHTPQKRLNDMFKLL